MLSMLVNFVTEKLHTLTVQPISNLYSESEIFESIIGDNGKSLYFNQALHKSRQDADFETDKVTLPDTMFVTYNFGDLIRSKRVGQLGSSLQ